MIIWVKEVAGILDVNKIMMWIKRDVEVKKLGAMEDASQGDIIIVSKAEVIDAEMLRMFRIVIYEEFFDTVLQSICQELDYAYDYYYLKNAMAKATNSTANTIITGSSYGLLGIDENLLTHEVNLSLNSQDLYYSLKGVYEIYQQNQNIKKIVLCCGYYYFYSDLSQTKNADEVERISRVYQPLFGDNHHAVLCPPRAAILPDSHVFDIQGVTDGLAWQEYERHYFHADRPRSEYAARMWKDASKCWHQLCEEEKEEAGRMRAHLHNKNRKRQSTYEENTRLFQEFISFCEQRAICPFVVVTPASKYYRKYFDSRFKDDFYAVLIQAEGTVHLLDLFDEDTFLEEDFNDMDHLSDSGARKMTAKVLELLQ